MVGFGQSNGVNSIPGGGLFGLGTCEGDPPQKIDETRPFAFDSKTGPGNGAQKIHLQDKEMAKKSNFSGNSDMIEKGLFSQTTTQANTLFNSNYQYKPSAPNSRANSPDKTIRGSGITEF